MAVCLADGHQVDLVYYEAEDTYLGEKAKTVPFQRIAKKIAETQPDIVAFSCVTDNYQYQLGCAKALKEIMPNVITVFGGVHPTAVPEKVLRSSQVDCVAIGEAEKSFSDFLREGTRNHAFELPSNAIRGIVFKKDDKLVGELIEGPLADLNRLPFPHKTPFFSSSKDSSHEYRIMTSRGCPFSCSYCFNSSSHELRGKSIVRQRTADNVIDELEWAKSRYSLKHILFVDDSFATNAKWVFEFCDRYRKEIGLPFACTGNPYHMTRQIAEALHSAGCVNMQIGIQSLSEELCQKVLRRKSNNGRIAQVIKDLKDIGIMVQADHMLGIPGDTLKLQEESILFYNNSRPDLISVFWLTYYPKTSIVEDAKQEGILTESDVDMIEEGKKLTERSYLTGGSLKNPDPYYGISLLLNYLPVFPKWLVSFLIHTRLYRMLNFDNYLISTVLPRVVRSFLDPRDFRGRTHIIRFVDKIFFQRLRRRK